MQRDAKNGTGQAELFAIGQAQSGFFSAKQAEAAGFARPNYSYHVRSGKWVRVQNGF